MWSTGVQKYKRRRVIRVKRVTRVTRELEEMDVADKVGRGWMTRMFLALTDFDWWCWLIKWAF